MMAATPASSKRLRDIERRKLGGLRPALHRDIAVAGVEPDRDAAGKCLRRLLHQRRIAHCGGADDDAGDAFIEPALDGARSRMPPPSCTGSFTAAENALDRRGIDRLARKGAVEIDDVQIFKALGRKASAPARPDRG